MIPAIAGAGKNLRSVTEHRNRKKLEKAIAEGKSKKRKAIAYYNLGLFHDNNGREAEAIPNYLQAIKLGLKENLRSKALAWLASSLYKTKKPREALKRVAESRRIADDKLKKFLIGLESRIKKSIVGIVNIKKFNSIAEAELAKNLLEKRGIIAMLKNKGVEFPGDMGDSYGADLFVAGKDMKEAKKILEKES